MNNPDTYSITFLLGAGMIADLCEWVGIALVMLGCSFSLGMWLGWLRKRRIAKIQAAEVQMNWFAQIKPSDPAFWVPVLSEQLVRWRHWAIQPTPIQPLVPACEVAQDCNGCFHCPDLQPPAMKLDV